MKVGSAAGQLGRQRNLSQDVKNSRIQTGPNSGNLSRDVKNSRIQTGPNSGNSPSRNKRRMKVGSVAGQLGRQRNLSQDVKNSRTQTRANSGNLSQERFHCLPSCPAADPTFILLLFLLGEFPLFALVWIRLFFTSWERFPLSVSHTYIYIYIYIYILNNL
jgi:hypothetical protein